MLRRRSAAISIRAPCSAERRVNAYHGAGGTVSRVESGSGTRWRVIVAPTAADALGLTLSSTVHCEQASAICTAEGGRLERMPAEIVPYPIASSRHNRTDASGSIWAQARVVIGLVSLGRSESCPATDSL